MSIVFGDPLLLLVGLAAIPVAAIGWLVTRGMDRARRLTVVGFRALLLVLLGVALAGPETRREHNDLTVVAVVDVSGSVRRFADVPPAEDGSRGRNYPTWIRDWLLAAADGKRERDRLGVVVFDGEASATLAPAGGRPPEPVIDVRRSEGTAIEEAIRLGLAMLPRDTAGRLVLISDGNETRGRLAEATELAAAGRADNSERTRRSRPPATTAAAGEPADTTSETSPTIPIDVLPIVYRVPGDVRIAEISAPTTAQPGQVVNVRVVLESARSTTGRLVGDREGEPLDLNGPGLPGRSRPIDVPAGRSVIVLPIELGTTPINRIAIAFVPDDPAADALAENNAAVAITATPGRGRILVVSRRGANDPPPIATLLASADFEYELTGPGGMPRDLLGFQDHDLVILADVPAAQVPVESQAALARHVSDLGGGLLMLGGLNSFGAGGWSGTPVADVLPLQLDPPADMILPTAALVLVMDESGSMARGVAGARQTQQEVANESAARAIESLRSDALVGVISFSSGARTVVEIRRNDEPDVIAESIRGITPGGGTNIAAALAAAERLIGPVDVDQKYVILLTDGRSPESGSRELAQRMADQNIRITTIGVGDDVDGELLRAIAEPGGGQYIAVVNPQSLPRVLVDSVQIVNRPLIKESTFRPVVRATGSTIGADLATLPSLGGLVVTAPRPEPDAVIEATHPDGEPLLARWQAGLGRATAFTSSFGPEWTEAWPRNAPARAFMLRLVRETTRSRSGEAADLSLAITDGRLQVTIEATGEDGPRDFLIVEGTVFAPDGPRPIRLRQTAPGRYEADTDASADGEYVVALAPRAGTLTLPPSIGGIATRRGAEFVRLTSDLQALDRVVERTGGRRLDPDDPTAVDLFDREGLPRSISLRPAWPLILGLLMVVYLADVATRRIAWSGTAIRRRVSARMAHVRSADQRTLAAAATAASLRSRSEDRRGAAPPPGPDPRVAASTGSNRRGVRLADRSPQASRINPAPVTDRRQPPPDIPPSDAADATTPNAPNAPNAPDTADPTSRPAAPDTPADPKTPAEPDVAADGPASTRASLLAAKRRARERLDGDA